MISHHGVLLQWLHLSFGIESSALEWMTFYLTDRQQSVLNAPSSYTATILSCGVPQAHVMSPTLLLLDTTDILIMISKRGWQDHLYPDDSQVYGHKHHYVDNHRSITPEVLISSVATLYDSSKWAALAISVTGCKSHNSKYLSVTRAIWII